MKRLGGSCHSSPNLDKVSLTSASSLNIFKAFAFPLPADALTLSQPVKACPPIRPLHASSPRTVVIFFMSISLVPVLEPHFAKWLFLWLYKIKVAKKKKKPVSFVTTMKAR